MENRPAELWHLLTLTTGARTWGYRSEFRVRYAGAVSNGYGLEDGMPTNIDELRQRMAPTYIRRRAADVALQLPELTRTAHIVDRSELGAEHDATVETMKAEVLVRALLAGMVHGEVLPVISSLRQATSRAKLKATTDLAVNGLAQGESCVIFVWEREIARELARRISPDPGLAFSITGEDAQEYRDRAIHAFQNSTGPCALVATLGSLREGVTLHRARTVIMHDLDWVPAHMLQAEKRIHRIGQRAACQSIWMLVERSIDTLLARALIHKARAMQDTLGICDGVEAIEQLGLDAIAPIEQQLENALRSWEAA
jgi:SNF2 family DNA or RNA helicase